MDSNSNSNSFVENKYYKLPYDNVNKNYIIKVSKVDNIQNNVSAYLEISENNEIKLIKIEEWTDNLSNNDNSCIRTVKDNGSVLNFVNNKLEGVNISYNCKILQESKLDLDKNLKIGAFDFETSLDKNNNVIPYYIGVRTEDTKNFYKFAQQIFLIMMKWY